MKYADMRKLYINVSTDSFTHRETFKTSSNHILLQNLPKSSYQVSVGHMSFWNINSFTRGRGLKVKSCNENRISLKKHDFFRAGLALFLLIHYFFWHTKESTRGVRLYRPSLSVSNDYEITCPAINLRNI